jgi:hypothetical protein
VQDSTHTYRLAPRARLLAVAALVSGILVAGCGGSSPSQTAATVGGATTTESTTATSHGATSASANPGPAQFQNDEDKLAQHMRASGVPNFPDPKPGRGFDFHAPVSSTALKGAQAKCHKLLPGGGPPAPGSGPGPSAQMLAKLLRIAECMRFPDPRITVSSNSSGVREITDFDGAILVFPSTINLQPPAYRQALAACGAPPLGLPD